MADASDERLTSGTPSALGSPAASHTPRRGLLSSTRASAVSPVTTDAQRPAPPRPLHLRSLDAVAAPPPPPGPAASPRTLQRRPTPAAPAGAESEDDSALHGDVTMSDDDRRASSAAASESDVSSAAAAPAPAPAEHPLQQFAQEWWARRGGDAGFAPSTPALTPATAPVEDGGEEGAPVVGGPSLRPVGRRLTRLAHSFLHAKVPQPYEAERSNGAFNYCQVAHIFIYLFLWPFSLIIPRWCMRDRAAYEYVRRIHDNGWWSREHLNRAALPSDDFYAGPRLTIFVVAVLGRITYWAAVVAFVVSIAAVAGFESQRLLVLAEGAITLWEAALAVWGSLQRSGLWSRSEFERYTKFDLTDETLARDLWYGWAAPMSTTIHREVEASLARQGKDAIKAVFYLTKCEAAYLFAALAKHKVFFHVYDLVITSEVDIDALMRMDPAPEPQTWGTVHAEKDTITIVGNVFQVLMTQPQYLQQRHMGNREMRISAPMPPPASTSAVNSDSVGITIGTPRPTAERGSRRISPATPAAVAAVAALAQAAALAHHSDSDPQHGVVSDSDAGPARQLSARSEASAAGTGLAQVPATALPPPRQRSRSRDRVPTPTRRSKPRVRFQSMNASGEETRASTATVARAQPAPASRTLNQPRPYLAIPVRAVCDAMFMAYMQHCTSSWRARTLQAIPWAALYGTVPFISRAIMGVSAAGDHPLLVAALVIFTLARVACVYGFVACFTGGLIVDLDRKVALMRWLHTLAQPMPADEPLLFEPVSASVLDAEVQGVLTRARRNGGSSSTSSSGRRVVIRGETAPDRAQSPRSQARSLTRIGQMQARTVEEACECGLSICDTALPLNRAANAAAYVIARRTLDTSGERFLTRLINLAPLMMLTYLFPSFILLTLAGVDDRYGHIFWGGPLSRTFAESVVVSPLLATALILAVVAYVHMRGANIHSSAAEDAAMMRGLRARVFASADMNTDMTPAARQDMMQAASALGAAATAVCSDADASRMHALLLPSSYSASALFAAMSAGSLALAAVILARKLTS